MCGIAGLVNLNGVDAKEHGCVEAMVDALKRRGPDGSGIESWDACVLGHRRLSIFDLSDAGRQPMLSPNGQIGIVFNGAIYNFRELRPPLEAAGYTFKSQTDTEVLIHGYDAWGIDELVKRLRGMFALALWDNSLQKLFLVRDRLGVKPLVFTANSDQIAFASTTRALHVAGLVSDPDEQAIAEYLEFGFITDDRTIYQGASKVNAACIVEWSNGRISTRTYWTPPIAAETTSLSFNDAVEETERLFLSAVQKRLDADVPVGALLSGGVDSSLVCWAVAKLGGNITAFTVGTPGDPADETADARATASRVGISHKVLDVSSVDTFGIDDLVLAYGEPFACASAIGMLRVSEAVKSEATVLLTGDGGDDVFLGYPEHRHFWLAEKLARSTPDVLANQWQPGSYQSKLPNNARRLASFLDYTYGGLGAVISHHDGLPVYRDNGLLGERLQSANVVQREIPWSKSSGRRLLSDFLEYDRRMRFVGEYLTKVDGATMYFALEARSPFLDQELWEFAAALPFDTRLRRGRLKAVLREFVRRRVGERVSRGVKRGFTIPVQRWLANAWRPVFEEEFRESVLDADGWIDARAAIRLLDQTASTGRVPKQLWYLLVLERWLKLERAESDQFNFDIMSARKDRIESSAFDR